MLKVGRFSMRGSLGISLFLECLSLAALVP